MRMGRAFPSARYSLLLSDEIAFRQHLIEIGQEPSQVRTLGGGIASDALRRNQLALRRDRFLQLAKPAAGLPQANEVSSHSTSCETGVTCQGGSLPEPDGA